MKCYLCGQEATDHHHIFNGSMRNKSEEYGAVVMLCRNCHESVHRHIGLRVALKREFQQKIMDEQGWDISEWREQFYKNYL